jgi:hypothetical protein
MTIRNKINEDERRMDGMNRDLKKRLINSGTLPRGDS